jgi:hypothetical protein
MHGPLSEIGLVEVLQLLQRGRRNGVLRLTGPDPASQRVIHLSRGKVTRLEPDAGDTALLSSLVRRHTLAHGDSLDDCPDPGAVAALRIELMQRAIGMMLHWTRGRFDYQETPIADGPLDVPIDALILELVAAETRRVELAPVLGEFRAVPGFATHHALPASETIELDVLHWRVLDAVDSLRDVAAIAAHLAEPLDAVGQRVIALMAMGILELRNPIPESSSTAASVAIEAGRYEDAVARLRQRVRSAPDDDEAWRTLGLAEVGAGRFERAIDAWQDWANARPERTEAAAALIRAASTMMETIGDHRD